MFHKIEHYNTAKKIVYTAKNINVLSQSSIHLNLLDISENVKAINELVNQNKNFNQDLMDQLKQKNLEK